MSTSYLPLLSALFMTTDPGTPNASLPGVSPSEPREVAAEGGVSPVELRGRLDLSQTMAVDSATKEQVAFSDLRATAELSGVTGAGLGLRLDLLARKSWNSLTDDRLSVREGFVRLGNDGDDWRFVLGRQLVLEIASAEVDGLRVERRFGEGPSAFLYGGLMPHPVSGAPNVDFITAGAGYDYRGDSSNHSGGAALSLYRGDLNRMYLSQRSYLRLTPTLSAVASAVVDFQGADALVPFGSGRGLDLTSIYGLLRYRPFSWLDTAVSGTHSHTILAGPWWTDWLNERRRQIGFVLDGQEPIGTRITSMRWTGNFELTRDWVPYLQLRHDWRHTAEVVSGNEAKVGLKWRPGQTFIDLNASVRSYFKVASQLAGVTIGTDAGWWGAEGGLAALRSVPAPEDRGQMAYDFSAVAWLATVDFPGKGQRLQLLAQYQGFIESNLLFHTFFVQAGIRL